jgi:hypothetical protein
MYCDNHFCFQGDVFINFHSLIDFSHENNFSLDDKF